MTSPVYTQCTYVWVGTHTRRPLLDHVITTYRTQGKSRSNEFEDSYEYGLEQHTEGRIAPNDGPSALDY